MGDRVNLSCLILTGFYSLFSAANAIAQTPLDSVQHIHEMVFTGTLKEMRKDDFAIPVEIYTRDYFIKSDAANLYQAIAMVAGIQANIDGAIDGSGDIEINGQDGPFTLIMIDGMPVSPGNAGLYALAGIPINIIERIEIIKGPASTIYGSDAMSGVVNVITRNPEHVSSFFGEVKLSSYLETNADLGGSFHAGKAAGLITASLYNMNMRWDLNKDGYIDLPLTNRFCIFSKWTFRNKFRKLSSVYGRYLFEDRLGGQMGFRRSDIGSDSIYGISTRTNRVEIFGNFALPVQSFDLTLQVSYTDHKQDSWYGDNPFFNEERNARMQLLYDKKIKDASDLTVGAAYRFYWYNDNLHNPGDTGLSLLSYPLLNHFMAAFVQDMIHMDRNNEILAGFRYEYNSLYAGHTFSPRFDYKWMDNKRSDFVRFSLGSGFKTPDVFIDNSYAYNNGKAIIVNGTLKTELAYGGQLDYEKKIAGKGNYDLEANVFFNTFINKLEANTGLYPDAIVYTNDGTVNVDYGLNLKGDLAFVFPLHLNIGITLFRNVNLSRNSQSQLVYDVVPNAPVFTATYALSYSFQKQGLSIDWTGLINSPMYLNTEQDDYRPSTSPWYCLMNLQVTKRFGAGLEFFFGAANLLNVMPQNPILRGSDPFNRQINDLNNDPRHYTFDASYIYAPMTGIRGFAGLRWHIR